MNPNVTKGARVRGLLEYLFGPGRSDEHTGQRVVAGYEEPSVLEPDWHDDHPDLTVLTARLEAPLIAAGSVGADKTVWHCSLSVREDERAIPDVEWRQIAEKFVERMGFGPKGEKAGCRWVAVHHGESKAGNDHIHIVVTLATEDGARVYPYRDFPLAQRLCGDLEKEHGLQQLSPAREEATGRAEVSRAESERARREGKPATDREMLRRTVRATLAASSSEVDWVERMKRAGLLVEARADKNDPSKVGGYSVAAKPASGKAAWFAGRTLDGDLSLPQVRRRWPGATPADLAAWKATPAADPAGPLDSDTQVRAWTQAADALGAINTKLASVPPAVEELPGVARSAADTLAQVAELAEPGGWGPVSRAADAMARAGAPPRGSRPTPRHDISVSLMQIAQVLAMTRSGQTMREVAAMLAVIVQATRLAQAIAELRQAQRQAAAAGQAVTAAARMLPVLERAADAGIRVPAAATASPRPGPGTTPTTTPAGQSTTSTSAAPNRRQAGAGTDRNQRDPER